MSAPGALPSAEVLAFTPAARFCVKGRGAPDALGAAGLTVPARPNAWTRDPDGTWCLRLGSGEFLLAHDADATRLEPLRHRLEQARAPSHVLPRADRCVELTGSRATARLLRVCDIDERVFAQRPDALALVLLADVSVALHAIPHGYRIWCDPTYVRHLVEALAAIDARSSLTRPAP